MERMTITEVQAEVKKVEAPAPARSGSARMRELTPAQRRAVMFAQQPVMRARAAKKAKDERQAALVRMWQEEDSESVKPRALLRKHEANDTGTVMKCRQNNVKGV